MTDESFVMKLEEQAQVVFVLSFNLNLFMDSRMINKVTSPEGNVINHEKFERQEFKTQRVLSDDRNF